MAAVLTLLVTSSCGGPKEVSKPKAEPQPVSGRTETRAGISLDFSEGWREMPLGGRPFTQYFENDEKQIGLALNDFSSNNQSPESMGEEVKQRFGREHGTIEESGSLTIDGSRAYRVVARLETDTGEGLFMSVSIVRPSGRATTLFVSSSADERSGQRAEMNALIDSIRITE